MAINGKVKAQSKTVKFKHDQNDAFVQSKAVLSPTLGDLVAEKQPTDKKEKKHKDEKVRVRILKNELTDPSM